MVFAGFGPEVSSGARHARREVEARHALGEEGEFLAPVPHDAIPNRSGRPTTRASVRAMRSVSAGSASGPILTEKLH